MGEDKRGFANRIDWDLYRATAACRRVQQAPSASCRSLHVALAMSSTPEALTSSSSHSGRTQAIREGDSVLFRLPSGDVKSIKLTKNA